MKRSFKTGVATGIVIGILAAMVMGSAAFFATDGFTNLTADKDRLELREINRNIRQLESMIDKGYLNEKDNEELEQYIYKGLLAGLGDPYSEYYTAKEYEALKKQTQGSYCGIGAYIKQDNKTMDTSIIEMFRDSPALEAGMKEDDVLKAVDGVDVTSMELDDIVSKHIYGKEGTEVSIKVYRPSSEKTLTLKVKRAQVEPDYVKYEMLDNKIGYIRISSFAVATTNQFKKAIADLQSDDAKGLIIDLRNNPGGVLQSAVDMLASLLPDGTLVFTKDKDGKGDEYYSKNGQICHKSDYDYEDKDYPKKDDGQVKLPMVLLVNENSASASEVFAQALKDYQWATVVGTQSFGKGIVQNVMPFKNGAAVKLTISSYFTKSKAVIQSKGVTPDIEVEPGEEWKDTTVLPPQEEDLQLQRAIKELSR